MSIERTLKPLGSQKNPGKWKIVIDRESLISFAVACFLAGVAVGWKCAERITQFVEWLVR